MKTTSKILLGFLLFSFVMGASFVDAATQASIELDITFSYQIEEDIYVGTDSEPFGNGNVVIPLLDGEGNPIVDEFSEGDIPSGIHVMRGQNEIGNFIQIIVPGEIEPVLKLIDFDAFLENAIFTDFSNGVLNGDHIYEDPLINGCANDHENPEDTESANDEYVINIEEGTGSFCSATRNGKDAVVLYYEIVEEEIDLDAPEITNLVTDPELPFENEGNEQKILVSFESNEYPIIVEFGLRDENGNTVDSPDLIEVNDDSFFPISYFLPAGLDEDSYNLFMTVADENENSVEILLGTIDVIIEDGDDNGGGGDGDDDSEEDEDNNKKKSSGPKTFESIKPVIDAQEIVFVSPGLLVEDTIFLEEVGETSKFGALGLFMLVLLILSIILLILIVIAAVSR